MHQSPAPAAPLDPPQRLLLGPGPSLVHPRVSAALGKPLLGHLDPAFLAVMDSIQTMLRLVFRTGNPLTLALSGTGSAGVEAAIANLLEPDDEALVLVNGVFGGRMCEMVERVGGVPRRLDRPWGEVFEPEEVAAALRRWPAVRLVALVHAETSTGARQPLAEIAPLCREREALLLVDAVTSLGGLELEVDGWDIDACASATQKCLSCPPGLAPVTFGPRALERIRARRRKVVSWYLDVGLVERYWAEESRAYHHTAPIAMNYALHEALALVLEEGLEARWARHARHGRALVAGLGALGFVPVPEAPFRLPVLTAVRLPDGLDEAPARRRLLTAHGIEIGGGLGPLAGQIWRIGLMGESARRRHVLALLTAIEEILVAAGLRPRIGEGLDAAVAAYGGEG